MRIDFDKRDSVILKGLAITAIVFHNFYHLAGPVHENEFTFDPTYFWVFVSSIKGPTTAIEGFFSFFGHFGVESSSFLLRMVWPRAIGTIRPPGEAFYGEESKSSTQFSDWWFCFGSS